MYVYVLFLKVEGRGGGWGIHISLAAIFEGIHIPLVICVRGYTYNGDTHITVTAELRRLILVDQDPSQFQLIRSWNTGKRSIDP